MVKMLGWFGLKGIIIGDPEAVERNMMQMVNDLVGQVSRLAATLFAANT